MPYMIDIIIIMGAGRAEPFPRIVVTSAWTVHWRQGKIRSGVCGEGGTWECITACDQSNIHHHPKQQQQQGE
jgi:hypothetical protein